MSKAVSWRVGFRRAMLVAVGLASVGAAVGVQFAPAEVIDIRAASTTQLAGVLGLLVLPMVTVGALLLDHRFLRRRRVEASIEQAVAVSAVPETVTAARPIEKPAAVVHAAAPRGVPAVLPAGRPVAGPRFEIVVENKARPQMVTVFAPVASVPVRAKNAA